MEPLNQSVQEDTSHNEVLRFILDEERLTKTMRHFGLTRPELKAILYQVSNVYQLPNAKEKNKTVVQTKERMISRPENESSNSQTAKRQQSSSATVSSFSQSNQSSVSSPLSNDKETNSSKSNTKKGGRRQSSPRGRRHMIFEPENYVYQRLLIYSDGAARGNPGESGAGVVLKTPEGEEVGRFGKYLGKKTNNYAEYQAVLLGLHHAREFGASEITILSDSDLLVRQLLGEYRVRATHLRELFDQIKGLLTLFEKYQVKRIGREKNAEADSMANRAIDEKL